MGQSDLEKRRRLRDGRCPVHGLHMCPDGGWFADKDGNHYTIVSCPRRDCEERAMGYGPTGPCKPIDEHFARNPELLWDAE